MNSFVARNLGIPLFGGFRTNVQVNKRLRYLENSQWKTSSVIVDEQWERLSRMLAVAYKDVPYYRSLFDAIGITPKDVATPSDMAKLPILTKDIILKNRSQLINKRMNRNHMYRNITSGSTGNPIDFYQTTDYWVAATAAAHRASRWCGYKEGEKCTLIWGSHLDVKKMEHYRERVKNFFTNKQVIGCFNLSDEDLALKVSQISKFQPKLIIGYSTLLYIFAEYLLANNITSIRPTSVISSANTLYDFQRIAIEKAFGCKLFNRYGSREFGCIASECEYHNGLHINAENLYIEFLEVGSTDNGQELYKMLCTSLVNYAMPFIRYEIGDLALPSSAPCRCGRGLPMIKQLKGRIHDLMIAPSGKIITGEFFSIIIMKYAKVIYQYQVIQKSIDYIIVKIVLKPNVNTSILKQIQDIAQNYLGNEIRVEAQLVDSITSLQSGKFQVTMSEVPFDLGKLLQLQNR